MSQDNIHHARDKILNDPEFQQLVKRKNAISTTLTIAMLVFYFGFVLLLAFGRDVLAAPIGNATLGIPIGIGVIIVAWVLTGIYVRWANNTYDALIAQFKAKYEA